MILANNPTHLYERTGTVSGCMGLYIITYLYILGRRYGTWYLYAGAGAVAGIEALPVPGATS